MVKGRFGLDDGRTQEDDRRVIVTPLPWRGGIQPDIRNDGRSLRVSAHPIDGLVSLSLWRDDACIATHQMGATDVSGLISLLADSLGVLMEADGRGAASA
jgi:hypothetical protein